MTPRERARERQEHWFGQGLASVRAATQMPMVITGFATGQDQLTGAPQEIASHENEYKHMRKGWPFAAIRPIANRFAEQSLMAGRMLSAASAKRGAPGWRKELWPKWVKQIRREIELLESHDILEILRNPNPIHVEWQLEWITAGSLQATGKAFWWFLVVDGNVRVWPLPAHWCTPVATKAGDITGWMVDSGGAGESTVIPDDQIAYFSFPDPANPFASLSPLAAAARTIINDDAIHLAQNQQFKGGHLPDHAFILGEITQPDGTKERPEMTTLQREELETRLSQLYGGPRNHGKSIVLDRLIADVKRLSVAPTEMDYMNSMKITKNEIMQMFGVNPIIAGEIENANRACHDEETELLTRRGWLRYDELDETDEAGTMNPETRRFEWQTIQKVHVYNDYSGEMVHLSGKKMDVLVTPDHRMWKTRHIQTKTDSRSRPCRHDLPWEFVRADELKCHDALPLATKAIDRPSMSLSFTIPGVGYGGKLKARHVPEITVPMNPFLAFLGWWVSEGWTVSDEGFKAGTSKRPTYSVGVRQSVGATSECEMIHDSFQNLGFNFYRARSKGADFDDGYERQDSYTWGISDKRLWQWLRMNCGTNSSNKRLPDFVFDLPGSQLQLLLDSMLLGDGNHRTDDSAVYFTKSTELADQVQTLAFLCGRTARIGRKMGKGVIPVTVTRASRRMSLLPKHISRQNYRGTVWCVTVPNGLIVTRRNGKPIISGNSATIADENFVGNVINPMLELVGQVLTKFIHESSLFRDTSSDIILFYDKLEPQDPVLFSDNMKWSYEHGIVDDDAIRAHLLKMPPKKNGGGTARISPLLVDVVVDGVREEVPPVPPKSRRSMQPRQVFRATWLKQHSSQEDRVRSAVASLLNQQTSEIVEALRRGAAPDARLLIAGTMETQSLIQAVRPGLMQAALIGAGIEESATKFHVGRIKQLDRRQVEQRIATYLAELFRQPLWGEFQDTTRDILQEALTDGVRRGLDARALADLVQEQLREMARVRALRLARTETTNLLNAGADAVRLELADEGIVATKEWSTTKDKETRGADPKDTTDHLVMDGQVVPASAMFVFSNGEQAPFPGHYSLSGAQRIHCRCVAMSGVFDQPGDDEPVIDVLGIDVNLRSRGGCLVHSNGKLH